MGEVLSRRGRRLAVAVGISLVAFGAALAFARVRNGGFETGDFTGWHQQNTTTAGAWFVYSGTSTPSSDLPIHAPPRGKFAAVTDQGDRGGHILFQNVHLRRHTRDKLKFILYYRNHASSFATPNSFDTSGDPNQQFRMDVLKAHASPTTTARKQILKRVFRTDVGDPNVLSPTTIGANLSRFAGRTVRLRFAEVDNQSNFNVGLDNVRVKSHRR